MDTKFELEWQKSKDKEFARLFWNKFNVSDFRTRFFPDFSRAYNMIRVIGSSSYWEFEANNRK